MLCRGWDLVVRQVSRAYRTDLIFVLKMRRLVSAATDIAADVQISSRS